MPRSILGEAVYRILILIGLFLIGTVQGNRLPTHIPDIQNCRPLSGPPGPPGPDGPPGPKGLRGRIGPTGVDALDGLQGPSGPTGPQGCNGNPGPRGSKGVQGVTGPQGPVGHTGLPGPMGPKGPLGPCECPTLPYARFTNFRDATVLNGNVIPFDTVPVESSGFWRVPSPGVCIPPENGVYLITFILNVNLENQEEGNGTVVVGLNLLSGTTTATGAITGSSEERVQIMGHSLQYLIGGISGTPVSLNNYSNATISVPAEGNDLGQGASYTIQFQKIGFAW